MHSPAMLHGYSVASLLADICIHQIDKDVTCHQSTHIRSLLAWIDLYNAKLHRKKKKMEQNCGEFRQNVRCLDLYQFLVTSLDHTKSCSMEVPWLDF